MRTERGAHDATADLRLIGEVLSEIVGDGYLSMEPQANVGTVWTVIDGSMHATPDQAAALRRALDAGRSAD